MSPLEFVNAIRYEWHRKSSGSRFEDMIVERVLRLAGEFYTLQLEIGAANRVTRYAIPFENREDAISARKLLGETGRNRKIVKIFRKKRRK